VAAPPMSVSSLVATPAKGKTIEEAEVLFDEFHRMVLGELEPDAGSNHLGRLSIFTGVREFPARVKCASLAWHTLHAAIQGQTEPVSTE
jgi:nitrogen fixation NifU-like protein